MNENHNGGNMELKTSTDPKIVKMFRRLEKFVDDEGLATFGRAIDFINAETRRTFAVMIDPDRLDDLLAQLDAANETIATLEDDNALLALIDAQNDVLMGRAYPTEAVPALEFDGVPFTYTNDAPPAEDSPGVIISAQEYEELINLRVKRARDKETITGLNATVKENKKGAETLQRQRDSYLAQLLDARDRFENLVNDLFYGNKITLNEARIFNGDVAVPGGDAHYNDATLDPAPRHAFTSDAIRDSDFVGFKPDNYDD
jgi:uncharacterized coiled-coil protein SlyX